MVADSANLDRLRVRRQALADERQDADLRRTAAPQLVTIIGHALGRSLSMDDFVNSGELHDAVIWPARIEDAPGLVSAYTDKIKVERVLRCIGQRLGGLTGRIGFHDKAYLGFTRVSEIDPTVLLAIADVAKESVLFYVDQPNGVVLVDCYGNQGTNPYSIVVQGSFLETEVAGCFDKLAGRVPRSGAGLQT